MAAYKEAYFMMFCGICDVIEKIEELIGEAYISMEVRVELRKLEISLKTLQQAAEEEIIGEERQCIVQNIHKK